MSSGLCACVNVSTRTLLCVIVLTVSLAVYLNNSASLGESEKKTLFSIFLLCGFKSANKFYHFAFKTSTELSGDNAGINLS